jgi:hypothetical protein
MLKLYCNRDHKESLFDTIVKNSFYVNVEIYFFIPLDIEENMFY